MILNAKDIYENVILSGEEPIVVPTGFQVLDMRTDVLEKGKLTLLAGRPGMGKSGLAMNIAHNLIITGKKVCYITMEFASQVFLERYMKMFQSDAEFLENLYIDDTVYGPMSTRAMTENVNRVCPDAELVVIDYLQLIGYESLQWLKGAFPDAAVLILTGVSRECEFRENHRPCRKDIECWENIEPYISTAVSIYRADYYDEYGYSYDDGNLHLMELLLLKGSSRFLVHKLEVRAGFIISEIQDSWGDEVLGSVEELESLS